MTAHTPEPWESSGDIIVNRQITICKMAWDFGGDRHANGTLPWKTAEANMERIVACVNACAGINPEAVPMLLAACKAVLNSDGVIGPGWSTSNTYEKVFDAVRRADGSV